MTIDSHVHFWKYDKKKNAWITDSMKILKQDYLPEHLQLTLKRNEVQGCVAVQASPTEYETFFLMELAKTHPVIKGVVGWLDFLKDNLEERLHFFSHYKIIKGWRYVVQSESDDFLYRKDFQKGIQALAPYHCTYDVLIYHFQMKPALDFVSRFPDQKFVIDHCAKPDIRNKKIGDWKTLIKEIAQHPRVYCKLSGLFTETYWKDWSPGDFYPYLDVVFEAFGANRLMFGSDWPVILLSGMYVQWKSLLEKYMENFSKDDWEKVFGENAIRFYHL